MAAGYDERFPVCPADFGSEFSRGEDVHGHMTLRIGRGLYRTFDGRIHARPRVFGTWVDWLIRVAVVLLAFFVGYLFEAWRDDIALIGWLTVLVIAAFFVGWFLHKWW